MSESYFTVKGEFENTVVIERSKFICYVKGVENEDDAKEFILKIKKMNSLATHNCYAYIADDKGLICKFSDDGEPQGTAGLPMLEVLKNKRFFKTVSVITRYFGGIKLGTGGLVRAYSGGVVDCLEKAPVLEMKNADFFDLTLDYDGYSKLLNLLNVDAQIISTNFADKIDISIAIPTEKSQQITDKINDTFCGNIVINKIKNGYFGFSK